MPPAFNLSQDQTLEFNHCYYFICLSFLRRRAQNYRLVIFRSSRFCIIPFVFSSTWFFMSWSSSKPDAHAYRFVIQFLKIVTASQRQDEYLTLSILKMQIFLLWSWLFRYFAIKHLIFIEKKFKKFFLNSSYPSGLITKSFWSNACSTKLSVTFCS